MKKTLKSGISIFLSLILAFMCFGFVPAKAAQSTTNSGGWTIYYPQDDFQDMSMSLEPSAYSVNVGDIVSVQVVYHGTDELQNFVNAVPTATGLLGIGYNIEYDDTLFTPIEEDDDTNTYCIGGPKFIGNNDLVNCAAKLDASIYGKPFVNGCVQVKDNDPNVTALLDAIAGVSTDVIIATVRFKAIAAGTAKFTDTQDVDNPTGPYTNDSKYASLIIPGFETGQITISGDAAAPVIDTQPYFYQGFYLNDTPDAISLTAHSRDGGTLSYQWYSSPTDPTNGGTQTATGGTAIATGGTGSSYTPYTSAVGTTYYYCVVKNTNPAATGTNKTATVTSSVQQVKIDTRPVVDNSHGLVDVLSSNEVAALPGDTVQVSVAINEADKSFADISNDTGLGAYTCDLKYYSSYFTYDSYTPGTAAGLPTSDISVTTTANDIKYMALAGTGYAGSAGGSVNVVTFNFKVAAGTPAGHYSFSILSSDACSFKSVPMPPKHGADLSVEVVIPPNAPILQTASAAGLDSGVKLTWDYDHSGSTPTDYNVSYKLSTAPDSSYSTPVNCTDTNYTFTGLTSGSSYTFRVVGHNRAGYGAPSNTLTAIPIAAPVISTAVPGDKKVTLTWGAVTGAATYNIYVSTTENGTYSLSNTQNVAGTSATVYSYSTNNLVNGTNYFFKVTAVTSGSVESALSLLAKSATPVPVPGAITTLAAKAGNRNVTLTWTAPVTGGAPTGYKIYQGTASGAEGLTEIADLPAGTLTSKITLLTNGTAYYFYVKAYNAQGSGHSSNEVSATPNIPMLTVNSTGTAAFSNLRLTDYTSGSTTYHFIRGVNPGNTNYVSKLSSCFTLTNGTWKWSQFDNTGNVYTYTPIANPAASSINVGSGFKIELYDLDGNLYATYYSFAILGELNGDGLINFYDANICGNNANGTATITNPALAYCADVNGDGKCDALDVNLINSQVNGKHNITQ